MAPGNLARAVLESGGHGRIAWVSDFTAPEAMRPALGMFRRAGATCTGWLPATREDHAPRVSGPVLLADPETGRRELLVVDGALREAMGEELRALARLQDLVFTRAGFRLRRYRLPADGDLSLASWLGGFGDDRAGSGSWLADI